MMTTLQLVLVKKAMVDDRLAGRTSVIIYNLGRFIIDSCYVFHSSICFGVDYYICIKNVIIHNTVQGVGCLCFVRGG